MKGSTHGYAEGLRVGKILRQPASEPKNWAVKWSYSLSLSESLKECFRGKRGVIYKVLNMVGACLQEILTSRVSTVYTSLIIVVDTHSAKLIESWSTLYLKSDKVFSFIVYFWMVPVHGNVWSNER